ncbi:major facilitator superfamily MFS_1 [Desulfurivibrio alkaliphilus AHT 2]|uniref:Major facilitator superfamily MFS_1 n=2 Tax=Desulfurivibrio alkaliphilus TaxID=427923 RepID=D6Z419_DESAT|nr:major facilitator superfamily MFS_1 [Desulfurivibrio alkaliphilus AHT 2]
MGDLATYLSVGQRRWLVVAGAVMIQFCLGAIYAWSVFTGPLTQPLSAGGHYGFNAREAAWIFSAGLATFAVVMVAAGRVLPLYGPRPVAAAGGLVLGAGYVLGGLLGSSFWGQFLGIGLIGGAGIGLAYVVPIAVGVKWFPDKKGLVSGLAVAGFGFGATLWVKLAGSWFGGLLHTVSLFGLPGVQSVFLIYGVLFALLVFLGSRVMLNPPAGYVPTGAGGGCRLGTEPAAAPAADKAAPPSPVAPREYSSSEMLRSGHFYILWLMFCSTALAGLMVIYSISLFGTDALQMSQAVSDPAAAARIAGTAMAWYAIFNGLGRIVWGGVSDRLGRKWSLFMMCSFQAFIVFAFYELGGAASSLIIAAAIIGFNFGGNFALFPAATADYFGAANLGRNYGWIFLSYGVAGILGPQIAGYFRDMALAGDISTWQISFSIAGAACVFAALLALLLKEP